jgi:tetratricopeptide (TPR) repeat protein
MARSFAAATPGPAGAYYHAASDIYYEVYSRGGEYFQKQYQKDAAGKRVRELENRIDYVLGSGNHSRAFLHRRPDQTLIELPLAWYAEKGGSWAMNPGYDRPDHEGLSRTISDECMFCHNGYPAGKNLLNGIDCQRCHGPGGQHLRGGAIVNPAKLSLERQADVCMQCHMETTASALPNALVRYGREPFSYRPGEPLPDFRLHFDRAHPNPDAVEINSSAYRLRQSECFLKSGKLLTCTTCHDPHQARHDAAHYDAACQQCHKTGLETHAVKENCAGCHMPKTRTIDVIHVAMTDHRIQRKPRPGVVAEIAEARPAPYRGEVVPYLGGHDELTLAAAQIVEDANLKAGIPRMAAAIERAKPASSGPYLDLAEAMRRNGQCAEARPYYEQALRHGAANLTVAPKLALCLPPSQAVVILEGAGLWTQLAITQAGMGHSAAAVATFEKALAATPDQPEAWNGLGGVLVTLNPARAEQALNSALRLQPNYPEAWNNLANLYSNAGKIAEARRSYETALRYRPDYSFARYNYAVTLLRARELAGARGQLETILKTEPQNGNAEELLGVVLRELNQPAAALGHFRNAVRIMPESGRAHLRLGEALAAAGDTAGAAEQMRIAQRLKQ